MADGKAKALTLLERALELSQQTCSENSSETVQVMNNLTTA